MAAPDNYSRTQIILHWTIAALVIFQLVFHEGMEDAWDIREDGGTVPLVNPHVVVGILILALAIWRLSLRLIRGVPPAPSSEPAPLRLLAAGTHWAFYALLFVMPFSGMALWFFEVEDAGDVHDSARLVFIALILLHIVGALAQHFWFKTDVLKRMLGRA